MIDLYSWTTPNGRKVHIMLAETGLDYTPHAIDIRAGDQFTPEFLAISPNNKLPAIVDQDGPGGKPMALFESGAILHYLAEKTGQFLPSEGAARYRVMEWLMFQMGGVGPMFGQANHFAVYAAERFPEADIAYGRKRYVNEVNRLYGVMEKRLAENEYIAGDFYSIADMAIYPWIVAHKSQGQDLDDFPNLKRWFEKMRRRPAVIRAYERGKAINTKPTVTEESRKVLFGQKGPRAA